MLDFAPISNQLNAWNQRRQQRELLIWGPRGLMFGLYAAVAIAAIARFRPFLTNLEVAYWAIGLSAVGLIIGVGFVLAQRRDMQEKARFADETFGLKERATAALELNANTIDAPLDIKEAQLEDTLSSIENIDASSALPFEINNQDWGLIGLAIALLLAAIILPNQMESILQGQRAVQQTVAEQIEKIEALEEAIENNAALSEEEREALLNPLQDARQELENGVGSREEALAALSQAESALRELEAQNSTEALEAQMAQAGSNINSQSGQPLSEAMEQGNLSQTAEELEALSESVSGLSETEQQELGRELSQTSSELQGINPELAEQLSEAGSALQQGNVEDAEQALDQAAEITAAEAEAAELAEAAGEAASELSEGRQEVTQSGQEGGEPQAGQAASSETAPEGAEGESGQTAEAENGAQSGQANQAGQGATQTEAQAGTGAAGGESSQSGTVGGTEGGGSTDNVFVPPFRDLSGEEGVAVELSADCTAGLENCGELISTSPSEFGDENSIVPYEEVYSEYANTAYESLSEDYIPLGMKEYVRDYFSSLEPE